MWTLALDRPQTTQMTTTASIPKVDGLAGDARCGWCDGECSECTGVAAGEYVASSAPVGGCGIDLELGRVLGLVLFLFRGIGSRVPYCPTES